jgi:tousled-like kinase
MSAGTQLQMAPQTTLIQQGGGVQAHQQHLVNHQLSIGGSGINNSVQHNNQDSNMSTGSSHSDKDVETAVVVNMGTTPEKLIRTPTERKRKRKAQDDGVGVGGGVANSDGRGVSLVGGISNIRDTGGVVHQAKGPRVTIPVDNKKINDYFLSNKHATNSPMRPHTGGAKSPSAQQQPLGGGTTTYPMYPPSPQPPHNSIAVQAANNDYFKTSRTTSNIVPTQQQQSQQQSVLQPPPISPSVNISSHHHSQRSVVCVVDSSNNCNNSSNNNNLINSSNNNNNNNQNSNSLQQPPTSSLLHPQSLASQQQQQQQTNSSSSANLLTPPSPPIIMLTKSVQTDVSLVDMQDRDTDTETNKAKADELARLSDEQKCQITNHLKTIEQHKSHINKCIDVVKKLLKQKSMIEKKEARQKCMQNRLRLGQFVTQRVGATFQENWTDGYAFQELAKRQEEITAEREEIDRQKKLLMKKRPTNSEGGRKRANSATATASVAAAAAAASSTSTVALQTASQLHNGGDAAFLKPDPVANSSTFTIQEYYECDEILKLRQNALKKEDADLQLEMEKLERERNLHIRELKRIHNEDQSRFNNHPVLNDRYLLLMLLGKGGFSEVHKAFDLKEQRYVACKVHQLNKDWKEDKKANYIK